MIPKLDSNAIAASHSINPESELTTILSETTINNFSKVQFAQTHHRCQIVNAWGTDLSGKKILEIGCGQGDGTVVLSKSVGDKGKVIAWDPASPEYGSPLNLGQAQSNLLSKPELNNISFHTGSPLSNLLANHPDEVQSEYEYEIAVLLHCIYYFPSSSILKQTLIDLHNNNNNNNHKGKKPIEKLCIAEYSLRASYPSQQPHILSVLAQQALETIKPLGQSESNVQTVLSPKSIVDLAKECGWKLESERTITPDLDLQDGRWEVGTVYNSGWMKEVDTVLSGVKGDVTRQKAWLTAARDAVVAAVDVLKEGNKDVKKSMDLVRTMDVWCAVFKRV